MSDWYMLEDDHTITKLMDGLSGIQSIDDRRVGYDEFADGAVSVSTVFLGLDHGWNSDAPILFETLIQGGVLDQHMQRCATWDEAIEMHRRNCERVKQALWASFAETP